MKGRKRQRTRISGTLVLLGIFVLTAGFLRLSAVALGQREELHNSGLFAEEAEAEKGFPENADICLEWDAAEAAWVEENIGRFDALEAERVLQNPGLTHFLYRYGNGNYESSKKIRLEEEDFTQAIPLFLQWDARWGYDSYGSSVIGLSGCGPTCLAMAVAGLTKDASVQPRMMADYAMEHDYYMAGTGTKWSLILEGAEAFGVSGNEIAVSEDAFLQELGAGHVLVLNLGPGQFTASGHFIVLCGMEDGKFIMHDPNNVENSDKRWAFAEIQDEIRAAWALYL